MLVDRLLLNTLVPMEVDLLTNLIKLSFRITTLVKFRSNCALSKLRIFLDLRAVRDLQLAEIDRRVEVWLQVQFALVLECLL